MDFETLSTFFKKFDTSIPWANKTPISPSHDPFLPLKTLEKWLKVIPHLETDFGNYGTSFTKFGIFFKNSSTSFIKFDTFLKKFDISNSGATERLSYHPYSVYSFKGSLGSDLR